MSEFEDPERGRCKSRSDSHVSNNAVFINRDSNSNSNNKIGQREKERNTYKQDRTLAAREALLDVQMGEIGY